MPQHEKIPFSSSFQALLLHLMIKDEAFLIKCSKYLKSNYFAKYLDYFYTKVVNYYDQYSALPKVVYFQNELKKFKPEDREVYLKVLTNIYTPKEDVEEQYIKDHITDFIKCNKIKDLYDEIFNEYDSENPDKVTEVLDKGLESLRGVNFNNEDMVLLDNTWEMIEKVVESRKAENVLTLGIKPIDDALLGGIVPGDVVLFLADTNVGKSITLVNCAARALKKEKKVFFLFTEGKKHEPLLRLITRLAGRKLKYGDIVRGRINGDESLIDSIVDKYKNNIMIKSLSNLEDSPTIEDVIASCKETYATFPFDVVIVDYADMLDTKRKNISDKRFADEQVYKGLSRIAEFFNVPVITASQATRQKNRKLIRKEDTAESYYKARLSSILITLNRTDQEVIENRMRIFLDKAREGQNRILVEQNTDYDSMIIFGGESLGLSYKQLDLYKNNNDEKE